MNITLAGRINERLITLGLTARAASLQAGLSDAFVTNILKGKSQNPRSDTLSKLAAVLQVSDGWLQHGLDGDLPVGGETDIVVARNAPMANNDRPMTIPVLGTAAGSMIIDNEVDSHFEGFEIDTHPIQYAQQPVGLEGQKDIYAIFVVGDSMDPMHPPGDIRFVQPYRPPSPGDTVIVQTKHWDGDPGQAYIKIYRRKKAGLVVLEQINPPVTLEIPAEFIIAIHRVVPNNECWGV